MTVKPPPPSWRDDMPEDPKDLKGPIPLGLRNRNPGNLRFIEPPARAWDGQLPFPGQGGFGEYETLVLGVRAACKQLLKHVANGRDTVAKLIHTWAPAHENDTAAYVETVCRATGLAPDEIGRASCRERVSPYV